ncbi:MAG: tyrosine-type recombinase/integrase [Clostridia bacterium]|nr:tyrosine-type recombinase/integrase [Clostridia bacterium]
MASIAKRGKNYRIMVSLGYGMDGKQIRKTVTFEPPENVSEGKSRKLAEAYAHDFEKRCRGVTDLGENMRFYELASWYYAEIAPNVLKGITMRNQQQLLNSYILPALGHLRLRDISTARLDEMINRLRREGAVLTSYAFIDKDTVPNGQRAPTARKAGISAALLTNLSQGGRVRKETAEKISAALGKSMKEIFVQTEGREGLSPATVENVMGVISAVFRVAVKKGIVEKNPVLNTTPPKRDQYKEKPFFDDGQCKRLLTILEELDDRQFALIVKTFLFTGLRAGELCALHWNDVDMDTGTITIRHTLTRLDGEYFLSTPKTKSSGRVVNIPADLIADLTAHKLWQEERGAAMGASWKHIGQVFTNESGGYHSRSLINAKFQRLLSQHDLPACRTHDLRHANASILINAGVPARVIADHLGHSSTKTTEDIYAHVFAASKAKLAETIISALKGEFMDASPDGVSGV